MDERHGSQWSPVGAGDDPCWSPSCCTFLNWKPSWSYSGPDGSLTRAIIKQTPYYRRLAWPKTHWCRLFLPP
jgi:hypothetical protein